MKKFLSFLFSIMLVLSMTACGDDFGSDEGSNTNPNPGGNLSSENTMTAFSLGVGETVRINQKSHVITVIVPHGTDVTNLAASFTVPQGATVKKRKRDGSTVTNIVQESGVTTNDFSENGGGFSYLVIAEDGTARVYELSVFERPESTEKLQSVSIAGQPCQFSPPDEEEGFPAGFYTEALFYDVDVTNALVDYTIADDHTLYISGTTTEVVSGNNYNVGFDDDGPKCIVDAASDSDSNDKTMYFLVGGATKIPYIETLTVSGYSVSGAGATSVTVKQVEYANPSGPSANILVEFQVELPADVENFETDSFQVTFDISLESNAPNSDFNWTTADSPGAANGDAWSDNTTVVNVGAETVYYLRQVFGDEDEGTASVRSYRIVFTKASN